MKIFVRTSMAGLHFYGGAKDLPEVDYLQHLHRHTFNFELVLEIDHADRDKEFYMVQNALEEYLTANYYSEQYKILNFKGLSCEMIAQDLKEAFDAVKVFVDEDGIAGGQV